MSTRSTMKYLYVIGTADTKLEEILFVAEHLSRTHDNIVTVDIGTRSSARDVCVTAAQVAEYSHGGLRAILDAKDRRTAATLMGTAFETYLTAQNDIGGIIAVGGGGGTSIATQGMRTLPLGIPKIMVSTLASSDMGMFIGTSDIVVVPTITDLSGLNRITRLVLRHAAAALSAMVAVAPEPETSKPVLAMTMFGVTTPAVTEISRLLSPRYEHMIFHATGTGGRAMEALVAERKIAAVVDITTTEIADLLCGGILAAQPQRLDFLQSTDMPFVGAPGALDIVNFRAPETVPDRFKERLFHRHYANITLMRTTPEESANIGQWIGNKLNQSIKPLRFLLPEKGLSALDIKGGPFFDPLAREALFGAIEESLDGTKQGWVERIPYHINDPEFAKEAVRAFNELTNSTN